MSTDTRIETEGRELEGSADETSKAENDSPDQGGSDQAPPPPGVGSSGGRRFRRLGVAALVLVTVAALACAAVLGWKLKEANDIESAADQARATARNYAVTLTSVNADGLDQNFADVLDGATGEFKEMYAKSSEQLKQLLMDNHATAKGTVIEDGIKSATETKVEVLLFVDQAVTNTVTPEPRMDRSRVVMTMELVDGRWLASKVDLP
ncbi:hypothetical protein ACWDUM_27835 [Rhodococcus sp. NPDC003322]